MQVVLRLVRLLTIPYGPQKIQYNLKVLAVVVGVEGGRASKLKRVLKVTYNGFLLLSP